MHTFIPTHTHTHTESLSTDTGQHRADGQDNQPHCPRPTPWPSGICGPRERKIERRGEGEEERKREGGRALAVALGKVYVTHRQEPERQTGRGRHRLSISCLWTPSAVCYRPSVLLYISVNLQHSSSMSLSLSV